MKKSGANTVLEKAKAMKTVWGIFLWALIGHPGAFAQSLPVSDIWLIELDGNALGTPRKLVNTGRYNNQPRFSPDGKSLYFTMEQPDGQTDIASIDLQSGEIVLILESPDSEYSPTPIPGKQAVSVVRVESPEQRQRLWEISLQDRTSSPLFNSIEPVGYHEWIDPQTVAMFILGESFDLHFATLDTETSTLLARNIGRTLLRHPLNGALLFVDKNVEPWEITMADIKTGQRQGILSLFPGVEDFTVDQKGRFWMGYGSKLYRSSDDLSKWLLMGDYSGINIKNITRMCVSLDMETLAIVNPNSH